MGTDCCEPHNMTDCCFKGSEPPGLMAVARARSVSDVASSSQLYLRAPAGDSSCATVSRQEETGVALAECPAAEALEDGAPEPTAEPTAVLVVDISVLRALWEPRPSHLSTLAVILATMSATVGEADLASSASSHRRLSSRDAPPATTACRSPTTSANGGIQNDAEDDLASGRLPLLGAATFSSSASRFIIGVRSVQERASGWPLTSRPRGRVRGGDGENLDGDWGLGPGEPDPRLAGQGVPGPGRSSPRALRSVTPFTVTKRLSSSVCAVASSRRSWWMRSSNCRSATAAGLLPLLNRGQLLTLFARPAKRSEDNVSEMCWLLGEQATRSAVRQLPPRDSSRRRVSRESR
mmetsp:Transcript_4188/g.11400  ORF Transcript_4188/g.11400 Transcript_4188/m.11400 type:complete len:351 (+) Transcript_4188:804-1856(+)